MVDRPYLHAAGVLAFAGEAEKARAMLARYHAEMTDTSIVRAQQPECTACWREIALAAGKPQEALTEFRRADVGYDGAPADECAPCLSSVSRAPTSAGRQPDSAVDELRAVLVDAVLEQSSISIWIRRSCRPSASGWGSCTKSMGNTEKAVENYRAFIELWKNADRELQPRVADARRRLARLTPVEKPRP